MGFSIQIFSSSVFDPFISKDFTCLWLENKTSIVDDNVLDVLLLEIKTSWSGIGKKSEFSKIIEFILGSVRLTAKKS